MPADLDLLQLRTRTAGWTTYAAAVSVILKA